MKNLHLIATDKPSVLILRQDRKLFFTGYGGQLGKIHGLRKDVPQNIYITSDEDINENDYIITKDGRLIQVSYLLSKDVQGASKVILTTDQDLIKDSVQPIDDEFLEWFVKNPSCEWVEVEDTCLEVRVCDCAMNENCLKPGYTIIIPQEEPIQELNLNCFDCNKSLQDCTCMEDTIDMTDPLEQAAKEYAEMHLDVSGNLGKYLVKAVFQDGANYQAERMYSEEDLEVAYFEGREGLYSFNDWFEQFKKK